MAGSAAPVSAAPVSAAPNPVVADPIRAACLTVVGTISIPVQNDDDWPVEATSLPNLRWMQAQILIQGGTMPIDKLNRWIGYIQGVLAVRGFLDVGAERDRTRPIFHEAYAAAGTTIPRTMDRKTDPIEG